MQVTKYEHACLSVEKDGNTVIIDPGLFTTSLPNLAAVVAVVLTHEHDDHWTPEHLRRILKQNPDAQAFGPAGVAAAASGFEVTVVTDGDRHRVGGFELSFFGGQHAVIHASIPVIDNVGVMVDGTLFYPGDALTVPPVAVHTLAVPAGAPWLKTSEAMDYVTAVAPKRCFPTHEIVLSQSGRMYANKLLTQATEAAGAEYIVLEPGEKLNV